MEPALQRHGCGSVGQALPDLLKPLPQDRAYRGGAVFVGATLVAKGWRRGSVSIAVKSCLESSNGRPHWGGFFFMTHTIAHADERQVVQKFIRAKP